MDIIHVSTDVVILYVNTSDMPNTLSNILIYKTSKLQNLKVKGVLIYL